MSDTTQGAVRDKHIVLGVTGSIAAYRAPEIASSLVKWGNRVDVILTESALRFVGPSSFAFSGTVRVFTELFPQDVNVGIAHIDTVRECDLFLVAPATADIIAKAANGIADDLLSSALLCCTSPTVFAPAMNENMYRKEQTQNNIRRLKELGCYFVGPEEGWLACGDWGAGRLATVEKILEFVGHVLSASRLLFGKKVLVTAGATEEPIDEVRFISNRSSGKMGYYICEQASQMGAEVFPIVGRHDERLIFGKNAVSVRTSQEMLEAVMEHAGEVDLAIFAAAVCDFCVEPLEGKAEKLEVTGPLELKQTPDVLSTFAQGKGKTLVVGFAAEYGERLDNARRKLESKDLDAIVLNDISRKDIGFGSDENEVKVMFRDGSVVEIARQHKRLVAREILRALAQKFF